MRRGIDPYQGRPPPSGFFYQRTSGAPSPSHSHSSYSHRSHSDMPQQPSRRGFDRRGPPIDEVTPSYFVEHLATFAVGRQFGLNDANDGIRKLKQMEKNSAIWAQPLILRLTERVVTVEDENGDLVEEFRLDLIEQPTAHVSSDPRDTYNNILLFVVKGDSRRRSGSGNVTEMHIFQCQRVPATEVADDLQQYIRGQYGRVRNGRRASAHDLYPPQQAMPQYPDDASIISETELFERDVNTLNRCFDDIERFVSRIQSAAIAQREIEQQSHRYRTATRRDRRPSHPDPNGILHMRAQMPQESEFVDILRKFKLSFNLLAKLKSHIHDPNAPELLHFLFTPLSVILEACHWGLGRNIAPQVVAPLLSLEARELLQNCLTSKESDIWLSLGETWRTPPEDWPGTLPPPYRPIFLDGFAPYGLPEQQRSSHHGQMHPAPLHRGESAPPAQFRQPPPRDLRDRTGMDTAPNTPLAGRHQKQKPMHRNLSVDQLDLDRLSLERERIDFEKAKMMERERRLLDEERKLRDERARVEAERNMLKQENFTTGTNARPTPRYDAPPSSQASPAPARSGLQPAPRPVLPDVEAQSPRQRAFVDDILGRGGKLVRATFDRVAQNPKELTVSRGEFLEVMEDKKNWWECRNVHQRVGYVPHTILSMVPLEDSRDIYGQVAPRSQVNGHAESSSHSASSSAAAAVEKPAEKSVAKEVSDAGVQANVHQVVQSPPQTQPQQQQQQQQPQFTPYPQPMPNPQPPYVPQPYYQSSPQPQPQYAQPVPVPYHQPPPPQPQPEASPVPTASMVEMLREQQQRKAELEPVRRQKPAIQIEKRSVEEQQMINELHSTVNTRSMNDILQANKSRGSTIQIHEKSSAGDVALWLEDKGFSYRVLQLFEGQDGAALFSLNKNHLIQACGRDEGSRLYSQILVQKNRSNYRTHSNAELKAILQQRKTHVEVTNTAPDEEPELPALS